MTSRLCSALLLAALVAAGACAKKPPVVGGPAPAPAGPAAFPGAGSASAGSFGAERPPDPPSVPLDTAVRSTPLNNESVDTLNGPTSPLKPVLFGYDSDELDDAAKKILAANAEVLKQYRTWVVTVEGHCDERGSAEYNLALGDRRALAARNYLVTLGIAADRLRTVSYGKEFPFEPGHDESAWAKNRRAHFLLTAK